MKTKTLALVLRLGIIALTAPGTYVLAHRSSSSSFYGVTGNIDRSDE